MGGVVRFRPYDLGAAPEVVALWNRAAGEAYPLRERVLRQIVDLNPSFDAADAVLAHEGTRLVGFGLLQHYRGNAAPCLPLRDRAWLTAVVVEPEWQRRGIGTRMFEWLLSRSTSGLPPSASLVAGGGIHYFFPGAPADLPAARPFLESLGFRFSGWVYDVRADIAAVRPASDDEALLAARGLGISACRPAEWERLLAFIDAEFNADWWHDADWFRRAGGSPADWLLLRRGDGIAGLARLHSPNQPIIGPPNYWAPLRGAGAGGLGPIGIAADLRGQGIGSAFLRGVLAALRRRGVTDAVADWTELLDYYGRAGFRVWKRYAVCRGYEPHR
ncbi:MAG TPA: GNAT family N-acetyltransferase [Thermomicrobiales bacterium]